MKHTFIYKGRLSLNFDSLTENATHYKKPDGTKAEYLYSKSADGLEFWVHGEGRYRSLCCDCRPCYS